MTKLETALPWIKPLRLAIIAMLLWAFVPMNPYGYYVLLRWVVCAVFIYLAVASHRADASGWLLLFTISAGIYNPILRVHLGRIVWMVVNVASIVILVASFWHPFYTQTEGHDESR